MISTDFPSGRLLSLQIDNGLPHGVAHQLGEIPQVQLLHHRRERQLHRLDAQNEHIGDLLIRVALVHQLQDLTLASA